MHWMALHTISSDTFRISVTENTATLAGNIVHQKGRDGRVGERWTGDRTVRGSNPTAETLKAVGPWTLLSGVYARGSKRPHQFALECVTVVDSTAHSKLPQKCVYAAENAALH